MAFDIQTRADLVKRKTVPVSSGTFYTGRWCTIDANGNAAAPGSLGSANVYLIILGNEQRPDSIGSASITVQYGQNEYLLNTFGIADTVTTTSDTLIVNTVGDLAVWDGGLSTVSAVAIARNTIAAKSALKIRTLR